MWQSQVNSWQFILKIWSFIPTSILSHNPSLIPPLKYYNALNRNFVKIICISLAFSMWSLGKCLLTHDDPFPTLRCGNFAIFSSDLDAECGNSAKGESSSQMYLLSDSGPFSLSLFF